MTRSRIVQIVAFVVMALSLVASGAMMPGIVKRSDDNVLRYTNVSVEGAPPFVALGTAIGAIRGLIVDYLWIKVNIMKEKGLYYEVMADADLITKLQPRFAAVWSFHGHNMAYNISVATHTEAERWEWVNAGIRLVRNQGLRYNPNDMELHRELAFWFAHKIEGVADDAHLYYKRAFCNEWHLLLGEPPEDQAARTAWIKEIADAPEDLRSAEARTPGVLELVDRLKAMFERAEFGRRFALDRSFVSGYTEWQAVKERSEAARLLGVEQQARAQNPFFVAYDEIAGDPKLVEQWKTLIAHVRKRVLKDEYNMNPQLMYEYTRDLGPIDWRHGSAHALYWSRRGSEFGKGRVSENDIYIVLNNDSQQMQAMQDLARSGRISFDLFSLEYPGRFPEPRWVDTIDGLFDHFYYKHYDVRGAGGERFITFLKNFMGSAVREWYRAGETDRAQKIMDRLKSLFGNRNSAVYDPTYEKDIRLFVHEQTFDEYQAQPHLAPSDVAASLRYGFRVGILNNQPRILRDALRFANDVTIFFKTNKWSEYETKFGTGRIKDILGSLEETSEIAYLQTITDPALRMEERMTMWANTDRVESDLIREDASLLGRPYPALRALVYDRAIVRLQQQFATNPLSQQMSVGQAFPAPPGLENARQFLLERQQQRQQEQEAERARDPILRRG